MMLKKLRDIIVDEDYEFYGIRVDSCNKYNIPFPQINVLRNIKKNGVRRKWPHISTWSFQALYFRYLSCLLDKGLISVSAALFWGFKNLSWSLPFIVPRPVLFSPAINMYKRVILNDSRNTNCLRKLRHFQRRMPSDDNIKCPPF